MSRAAYCYLTNAISLPPNPKRNESSNNLLHNPYTCRPLDQLYASAEIIHEHLAFLQVEVGQEEASHTIQARGALFSKIIVGNVAQKRVS